MTRTMNSQYGIDCSCGVYTAKEMIVFNNDKHAKLPCAGPQQQMQKGKPEPKTLLAAQHRLTTPLHTSWYSLTNYNFKKQNESVFINDFHTGPKH